MPSYISIYTSLILSNTPRGGVEVPLNKTNPHAQIAPASLPIIDTMAHSDHPRLVSRSEENMNLISSNDIIIT